MVEGIGFYALYKTRKADDFRYLERYQMKFKSII